MKIRETLRRKNQDLEQDLEHIVSLAERAQIVSELEPYRIAFLTWANQMLRQARANLRLLERHYDSLLPDVLSETSTLLQYVRLIKFRYLRGLYRAGDWDRVCLRTITWLHEAHPETASYPAVFADDDVSIIPAKGLPFYFFPCLEQRGLRFQPLFFHEFGHLLYTCHKQELDALVGEFQQVVESELLPVSQRNDQYAQEQARIRQSIVETWYKWTQEFFCDAVGLVIGGPCFLNAFSEYISKFQMSDYYRQPSDLHGSTHPISRLRIELLTDRAEANPLHQHGHSVLDQWSETAALLDVTEDHHGFYSPSLKDALKQTLNDMIVEVSPRECTQEEAAGTGWDLESGNLVSLLNKTWLEYLERPTEFRSWEQSVLQQTYGLETSGA